MSTEDQTKTIVKLDLEIFHSHKWSCTRTGSKISLFIKKRLHLWMNHKRTSVTFFVVWRSEISPSECRNHAWNVTIYHKIIQEFQQLNFPEKMKWFFKYQPQAKQEMSRRRTQMSTWVAPSCLLSASPSRREGISSRRTECGTILPGSWCGGRPLPSAWAEPSWQTSGGPRGSWGSSVGVGARVYAEWV